MSRGPKREPVAPDDRKARERIIRELDKTFLVEAGAGSGKTRSLVDRMIALVASGRTTIGTMAAVTFTRKAAAELRGRFQLALEDSLRFRPPARTPAEEDRLVSALKNLEQGFIGTIHSFCAGLLRERPVEIGIDPDFEEMDELEDGIFRESCWQDFLAKVRVENEDVLEALDEVGIGLDDLKDGFQTVSFYPDVVPARGSDRPPEFVAPREELVRFLAFAETAVPKSRPEKGYDGLQTLIRRLSRRRRNLGFSDPRVLMETLELCDRTPSVVKNRWPSKEEAESSLAAFEDFSEKTVVPALRAWREFRHSKVLDFLSLAVTFYRERRRRMSKLNFEDQLMLTAELLRDHPEVRAYFRERYGTILVDEFQDTDPIQAEILFYLAGGAGDERDWTKIDPEPGSLFLVGDPKQSIYRFRRADIDIYSLVKERIVGAGGEVLELTSNFRSLGCITDWANSVFESQFPHQEDGYQARFARLRPSRKGCSGAVSGVFKITVPRVDRNREKDIAEFEAARIAEFIKRSISGGLNISGPEEMRKGTGGGRRGPGAGGEAPRPARPGDFLILFHYKKNMELYARELEGLGIPFEISGSEAFSDSPEIGEIVNLLQALKDPGNPVLTVAVLKGLFFGASDQDLLEYSSEGGDFSFLPGPSLNYPQPGKIRSALQTLRDWWEWSRKVPPSVLLERVVERSGLVGYLVSSEMGSSRAGNIFKLLEVVRTQELAGITGFSAVADFVAEWIRVQTLEEMSLTPGRPDAVRLMNLHKAKGLEAPVVFLANPVGVREHEPDKHIVRTGGGSAPVAVTDALVPGPVGYFLFRRKIGWQTSVISRPVDWERMAAKETVYEAAEVIRLLYVAATRARDLLIISRYAGDLGLRKAWGVLDQGLDDISELGGSLPEGLSSDIGAQESKAEPPERKNFVLKKGEYGRVRAEIAARNGKASRAGYFLESVTSLVRRDRRSPDWWSGGLGMSWGTAVHSLLSLVGKSWPEMRREERDTASQGGGLLLQAEGALVAAGRDPAEGPKLAGLVASILSSGFWRRAMNAETRFFEIPFSVRVEPCDPEYHRLVSRVEPVRAVADRPLVSVPDAPLFLSGAIDLVFRERDGWVIVDYKTEAIGEVAAGDGIEAAKRTLDSLVEHYSPQVALYTRFWGKTTGEKVKESGLYFTSINVWKRIG